MVGEVLATAALQTGAPIYFKPYSMCLGLTGLLSYMHTVAVDTRVKLDCSNLSSSPFTAISMNPINSNRTTKDSPDSLAVTQTKERKKKEERGK